MLPAPAMRWSERSSTATIRRRRARCRGSVTHGAWMPRRVLALRPDLVLSWPSGTPAGTVERLRSLGVRVVEIPTFRLADVAAALRSIGHIAGTEAVAEAAAQRYEVEIRELRASHAGARRRGRVRRDRRRAAVHGQWPSRDQRGRRTVRRRQRLRGPAADRAAGDDRGGDRARSGRDPEHGRHDRRPGGAVAPVEWH